MRRPVEWRRGRFGAAFLALAALLAACKRPAHEELATPALEQARPRVQTIGTFDPAQSAFFLKRANTSGEPDISTGFGTMGDRPVVGDWDRDGYTSIGLYRPSTQTFYLSNSAAKGNADVVTVFRNAGSVAEAIPLAGDWDGNGTITVGLYEPSANTFYLRNARGSGRAEAIIPFGIKGDQPVVGDWNGDGTATIGVYRQKDATFYLRNSNSAGNADLSVTFGLAGDKPVTGDWDGNGTATVGVYRPALGTFFLRNANVTGQADITASFGSGTQTPIAGTWQP